MNYKHELKKLFQEQEDKFKELESCCEELKQENQRLKYLNKQAFQALNKLKEALEAQESINKILDKQNGQLKGLIGR